MKKIVLALLVFILSQSVDAKARNSGFWSLVSDFRLKSDTITVVDNTERLLAEADSLARLYRGDARESVIYLPIVFTGYDIVPERGIERSAFAYASASEEPSLTVDRRWLDDAQWQSWFERYHAMRIAFERPELVPYYFATMAEPPKEFADTVDISKNKLKIEKRNFEVPVKAPELDYKTISWIHKFDASFQFSQAYISENWYQGGNNNLNIISDLAYSLELNQAKHPKKLFQLDIKYKLGVNSANDDQYRKYSINEDLFQVNSKFGLKATKKFYYSTSVQFKTQLLQNFKSNTYDLSASFLTPGELNAGIGMTYNTVNKKNTFKFDASLSPLSYNMKICRAIHKMDPTTLGIDAGEHLGHEVGSSGEFKLSWTLTRDISMSARLFAFTDYSYVQSDLETTINFSINKYLSTQIYAHLRYDDSVAWNDSWQYWQFKEILSFGLQYKFRM
ncbi:MAG: DUF3078 domain-containing protein [Bacteroidales bacterium]|nr:DUF3078 domain-containing protein [Bacteroidales bacterium]MDD6621115.1 DUF3078 domain-containing protein [Bacteroidales bacterium]